MKLGIGGIVFATAFLGALASPLDINKPQNKLPTDLNKEPKHIFGIDFDFNLIKNSTLIPTPSFVNLSTGYGDGWGLGGGITFPSYFPLSLFIPPFNLTYDLTKYEQANLDISAGAGNISQINVSGPPTTPTPGWTAPSTTLGWSTPPPTTQGWEPTTPGWAPPPTTTPGWAPTTTTSGWALPTTTPGWAPPTTTQGWAPPTTTPGWEPPSTTPGWAPPTTTPGWESPSTTEGWASPTTTGWTTTPGWAPSSGWSKSQDNESEIRKGGPGNAPEKPASPTGVKPKPHLPNAENLQASGSGKNPGGDTQSHMSDLVESNTISELPGGREADNDEEGYEIPLNLRPGPKPAEVEETEHYYNPIYYTMFYSGSRSVPSSPPFFEAQDAIPGDEDKKKAMAGKVKRHAEPRTGDFEIGDDEENESEAPEEEEEREEQVDLRKAERDPTNTNHYPGYISGSKANSNYNGGKTKPRPYGMDKPSKARPILGHDKPNRPQYNGGLLNQKEEYHGSLLNQKEEYHGGLLNQKEEYPGGLLNQKEEIPILDDGPTSDATTVFGFQLPSINWSSFTDIFESFMGSRTLTMKTGAMAKQWKSDGTDFEKCVEDTEEQSLRSPEDFDGGFLCGSGKKGEQKEVKRNLCDKACTKNGFSGGSCVVRKDLMPGCLCRMPNSREYGIMLELFREDPKDEILSSSAKNQTLKVQPEAPPCKRCACQETCKKQGSFSGFCAQKCYCANPWSTIRNKF